MRDVLLDYFCYAHRAVAIGFEFHPKILDLITSMNNSRKFSGNINRLP